MTDIRAVAKAGVKRAQRATVAGKAWFRVQPSNTGASTTWRVDMNRALALTGTSAPTNSFVISGVAKIANSVLVVVIMTDSPISALAMYAMMLLAVPPGHALSRATPVARAGSKPTYLEKTNPRTGMTVNCSTRPRTSSQGMR
eukprot:CAMPEP_0119103470 /NCGR_PEP_ID=MMETSP1180-20130426/1902_1 /TAXON_ID=3052 ORGANISM="Chlamydomonas cf sp, Strain CCMP681" /NCGR_SAMPLE_ID=MMETSP1180 /ASSEMBLY_ACC=CAM_ASM_000741 /LENGTH=142 /DNA_ID=CAMNT_0007087981 /DNA_START=793 /DNA_END=1221 /DNA_ORIENTATION=+